MLVKYNISPLEYVNTSHSVTLVPRLEYSVNLLDEIVEILKKKRNDMKKSNKVLISDFDEIDNAHLKAIKLERTIAFSLEILTQTKKRTASISGVTSIPEILPTVIPMIRTVSAQLFDIIPNCSQKLSELSVQLGSIVLDSATLTKARFDFSQSNEESSALLNEVKLMVDSKISKQYPNLDFFKLCNT
ncbi:MAG: hypothetical protein ACE5DT_07460 [Nitrosopumilus sp.]